MKWDDGSDGGRYAFEVVFSLLDHFKGDLFGLLFRGLLLADHDDHDDRGDQDEGRGGDDEGGQKDQIDHCENGEINAAEHEKHSRYDGPGGEENCEQKSRKHN